VLEACRNDAKTAKELLAEARSVAMINIAIKVVFIFSFLSLGWKLDHLHGSRASDMPSSMEVGMFI
jgi:hypothetical protein